MFGLCCSRYYDDDDYGTIPVRVSTYSLPAPLPSWPQGEGSFGTGIINLGELEVKVVQQFRVLAFSTTQNLERCVTFYAPRLIPADGFFVLGHSAQPSNHPHHARSFVLVARKSSKKVDHDHPPPLVHPVKLDLIYKESPNVAVWRPCPPTGYRALGFIVTRDSISDPKVEEVMCVREDLTQSCQLGDDLLGNYHKELQVFNTKLPFKTNDMGVPVGTFVCTSDDGGYCLKNLNPNPVEAMPNMKQIEALIHHYGPTVYFHPNEKHLPSLVPWFSKKGSNGGLWLDLPSQDMDESGQEVYVHVKPAYTATFTDIDMWFSGPANNNNKSKAKWEHFTLRISNFNGELYSVYFTGHYGGKWVDASRLEFVKGKGNKPNVYSAKGGHTTFPKAGTCIIGLPKLGIGIGLKVELDKSNWFIESSKKYRIVLAEHLDHDVVENPNWLRSRSDFKKTITRLMLKKLFILGRQAPLRDIFAMIKLDN